MTTKIKRYAAQSQSNSNAAKGTHQNPYSKSEYESMCDAGTWTGGHVEGMGYVGAQVEIIGSSHSSGSDSEDSYDSWSDPFGSYSNPWASTSYDTPKEEQPHPGPSQEPGAHSETQIIQVINGHSHGGGPHDNTVLPSANFRGYKATDPSGCLNRCKEMLSSANSQLSGEEICMVGFNNKGRVTAPSKNVNTGILYINEQLKLKHPVIVAVDYKPGTSLGSGRQDQAGDHFVIIVGGDEHRGYRYYDPATGNKDRGTSPNNVFISQDGLLKSTNTCTGKTHYYTLSSIRKNKK